VIAVLLAAGVLTGTVTIGPLTPVCRVGVPCDGPAKRVVLTFSRGGAAVRTTTDPAGDYRVRLPAGVWRVSASAGMHIAPATVTVRSNGQRADFEIDTGIR
jgi:hypothetical protein